jgi:hypothetical protein
MNIEISVLIEGEPIRLNSDLKSLLDKMVGSYIKQKFLGGMIYKTKEKNPNTSSRKARPHLTEEEEQKILERAKGLQSMTQGKAAILISNELNRSVNVVYTRLYKASKEGILNFHKYNPGDRFPNV